MSARLFILYDSRAVTDGTDDAAVFVTADSLKEARRWGREDFHNCAVYSYAKEGEELTDERLEGEFVAGAWLVNA